MVLIMGQNNVGNILHIVTGPESDAAMAVNGSVVLDITPALKQMATDKPVVIHMTKCMSEHKLVNDMQASLSIGAAYPFLPPMIVFGPKAAVEAITPTGTTTPTGTVTQMPEGECSLCKNKKTEFVPKVEPKICYACMRIELGLKRAARTKKQGEGPV